MLIKLDKELQAYTNGIAEYSVSGPTLSIGVGRLFDRFPQLAVFLLADNGEEAKKTSLIINGDIIEEENGVAFRVLGNSDIVELRRDIPCGEGTMARIVLGVVLVAASVITAGGSLAAMGTMQTMAFSMGMGLVISGVSALIMGAPTMEGLDNGSPTYKFNGAQNTTQEGTPVGIVYGEHRVAGHVLNIYTDVDGKDNYLYAQLGICEGPIESITDIKVGERSADYYGGAVETQVRLGEYDQDAMSWFNRIENTVSYNNPYITSAGQMYDTDDNCNAAKVIISCPAIYKSSDEGMKSHTVQYKVEYRKAGDSEWIIHKTATFSGKTKSEQFNEHLIEFPEIGSYEIKITKTSAAHTGDINYQEDFKLDAINSIVYDLFTYPCTAQLGVKIRANDQLSGAVPSITSIVKGKKIYVPSNYDPVGRVYDGQWDGTLSTEPKYSNNPAWCLYDFITNTRYGLGRHLNMSNMNRGRLLAQLYMIGQYCDEIMPDGQPRFQLDLVIDSTKTASEWLKHIAALMRATVYYSEGRVQVEIDRPKPISHVFSMGNIIKGSYTQSGVSARGVPNIYEVQFMDKERSYEVHTFRLEDEELQVDSALEEFTSSLDLRGISRMNQAIRIAKFALLTGKYSTRSVSFRAGSEALTCCVGDVVGIQHDVPQWGYGGRVIAIDEVNYQVELDSEVTLSEGKSYQMRFQRGSYMEIVTVTSGAGTHKVVALANLPFTFELKPNDIAVVGETGYDVYPFRLIAIKRLADDTVELTASEYNESIYSAADDITGVAEVIEHSYTELSDPARISVSNVALTERIYRGNDGSVKSGIDVTYSLPYNVNFWEGANVYFGIDGEGIYEQAALDKSGMVFLPNLEECAQYEVVVCSQYKNGMRQTVDEAKADGAYSTLYLQGKTKPPESVSSFTVVPHPLNNNYAKMLWEPWKDEDGLPEPDLSHYEIRLGDTWETGDIIANMVKEKYYNEYFIAASGTYKFWIKAIDTSSNYANDAVSATLVASVEPADVTGFVANQMREEVVLTWNANADLDVASYEIRQGVTWDTGAVINNYVAGTYLNVQNLTEGTMRYWIKARDRFGNMSVNAVSTEINVANLPQQNVIVTFDEVARGWSGTHTNTIVVGDSLTLDTANKWDSGSYWDDTLTWDDTEAGVGTYETLVYDLGTILNCGIVVSYIADLADGNYVHVEINTSEDNVNWDGYKTFYGGYITARYVKYKLTLTSLGGTASVSAFNSKYDVPDVRYKGSATITDANAGVDVTFSSAFTYEPVVTVTVVGGIVGFAVVNPISTTGFTVKIYNTSGTPITGSFNWSAEGY